MTHAPTIRHTIVFRLVAIGCGAFMVLTAVAMFLFTGGTQFDQSLHRYDFFDNFFSDLGGIHTPAGRGNFLPSVLFFAAMIIAGASVATFLWAIQHFHRGKRSGGASVG